jgi:hypothetical protein
MQAFVVHLVFFKSRVPLRCNNPLVGRGEVGVAWAGYLPSRPIEGLQRQEWLFETVMACANPWIFSIFF